MKHWWLWWGKEDVRTELQQLVDEGRAIETLADQFQQLLGEDVQEDEQFQAAFNHLLDQGQQLPMRADYAYNEPSDLTGIHAQRPPGPRKLALNQSEAVLRDKIKGAWLGRCAGCLLGKPIEGIHSNRLNELLEKTDRQKLSDYVWRLPGLTEQDYRQMDFSHLLPWRTLNAMPEDDDTNYTVLGMALVKLKGLGFTSNDMADFWMDNLPILRTCTAERVAYRNFTANIEPPASAVVRNPYREWIGAQIRADFFGYVALGQPELAAELAWRDAAISHTKNGIYGAMWVAAMLAAAAIETDVRRIIEIGLSEIPASSRFAEAISAMLKRHAKGESYASGVEFIHQTWNETHPHHWCHTIVNAQIVTLGLLYGEGDYEQTITRSVQTCFDTDCNGATAGSIIGMVLGADALPEKWLGVMNDTIHTGLTGYHTVKISELAEEMFQLQQGFSKSSN